MAKKKEPADRPEGLRPDRGITLVTIEALKVLISLSGMNQKQLAEACHLTESQVSEYLSGETALGAKAVAKFAYGLKVSPELLAKAEGTSLEDARKIVLAEIEAKTKAKAPQLSESPAPTYDAKPPAPLIPKRRHLRVVEGIDPRLEWLEVVSKSDERPYALPFFESQAAGTLDDRTATKAPFPIFVNGEYRKCKAVRVDGDSMMTPDGQGIHHRDILIVRRSRSAKSGDIVVALVDHEGTIKRYLVTEDGEVLHPDNPKYRDIPLAEPTTLSGVVLAIYRPK